MNRSTQRLQELIQIAFQPSALIVTTEEKDSRERKKKMSMNKGFDLS